MHRITRITLVLSFLLFGFSIIVAAPAEAKNCKKISDLLTTNHGAFRARVYSRACNSGTIGTHWWEVYGIRGSVRVDENICGPSHGDISGERFTFHMNDRNGVSHTFRLWVPCGKPAGTYTRYRNVDSWMGRTYPSHRSFGVTFHCVLNGLPDRVRLKTTNLG